MITHACKALGWSRNKTATQKQPPHNKLRNLSLAILLMLGTSLAWAHAPTVEIKSPSGDQYVLGFPALVQVTLQLSHIHQTQPENCQLDAISDLKVTAQHANDDSPTEIHFNSDPALPANPTLPFCTATYSFDWSVGAPGSYTLLLTTKHGRDGATDSEEYIEFIMRAVEYPAPPAVANAYINSDPTYKAAPGKKRGCIISKIAEKHAKYAGDDWYGYGDKGGPYDEAAIEADVDYYYISGNGC